MLRELKNTAARGLYAPFPHFQQDRFTKALSLIFPGRHFRLYSAPPPELKTMAAGFTASLWRPFLDPKDPLAVPENSAPVLIPVIPGIQGWRGGLPYGLCAAAVRPDVKMPPDDFLPPVLLAQAARGLYDLIAAAEKRANPIFPRIETSRWQRCGLYLTLRPQPSEEWAEIFRQFLESGFLLPPVPAQPAIIPGILSPGEKAKLVELLTQLTK
jgi:hypothetical protein